MDVEHWTGNDEYHFVVGCESKDQSLLDGPTSLVNKIPSHYIAEMVEDTGDIIDASKYKGVGIFFNHFCSLNIYVENMLHDHNVKTAPHIMFFVAKNTSLLQ